ncbi:MAG: LD-carboxypeptidase [Alphaproteobacteria bacterium]|nr:LD-carboxypeptidase [Alphaproteobacteria bacterium]
MIPAKLQKGDEIRVIAPSISMKVIGDDCRKIAKERFEAMGLKVSFGKHTLEEEFNMFASSDVFNRADDIMEAFLDKNVKAIFTILGGFNSNQILPFLDYEVIKNNPKILCGYSDITALLSAIEAKTGLVTFYGPHYSSIGMKKGNEYTLDMLEKVLFEGESELKISDEWSDDLWFKDQENRDFIKNEGWWVLQNGNAKGELKGGNLSTLILLNGTPYQPYFAQNTILMIEECNYSSADDKEFLRQFQALAQRDDFANIKAILIGRFQKASNMTKEKLKFMIDYIPQLKGLPIIANLDFGHTTPIATLPVGGMCEINNGKIKVWW